MSPVTGFAAIWAVLAGSLALAVAGGMWLTHAHGSTTASTRATQLLCVMLALLAFFATGFAFAMGGVRGDAGVYGAVSTLGREWSPGGTGRGLLGLQGFFLSAIGSDPAATGLFAFHSSLALIAAIIALVPWTGQARRLVAVIVSVLFGGLLYPAYANWVWGGGWLAGLGIASGLGHGVVDLAGSGVIAAAAGLAAIGGLAALPHREDAADRPGADDNADRKVIGLVLAALGWAGLIALNTAAMFGDVSAGAAANPLIAFACATACGLLYSWFAAGEPDLTVGICAGLAGLAAIIGGAPLYPAWTAALVGGVAGIIAPLLVYVLQRWLRRGPALLLAGAHAGGGLWGLLAIGLFADGRFGAGINGVGERTYLGMAGQGVTGIWPAAAVAGDPGQLKAQAMACVVLLAFAVAVWLMVRAGRLAERSSATSAPSDTADVAEQT